MAAEYRDAPPTRGRAAPRLPWRGVRACLLALAVAACGSLSPPEAEPDPEPELPPRPPMSLYDQGIEALEMGDFRGAEDRFRRVASRCESGEEGRSALVALTLIHLDLRNREGRPQEAARMAAIHLNLPDASKAQRALTRTLYLNAVYQGAEPLVGPEDLEPDARGRSAASDTAGPRPAPDDTAATAGPPPDSAARRASDSTGARHSDRAGRTVVEEGPIPVTALEPARRFGDCHLPPPLAWRGLPEYPGVPPSRWAAAPDTVVVMPDTVVVGRSTALERRVRELEAELARIRKLLKGGGGERPRFWP